MHHHILLFAYRQNLSYISCAYAGNWIDNATHPNKKTIYHPWLPQIFGLHVCGWICKVPGILWILLSGEFGMCGSGDCVERTMWREQWVT